MTILGREESVRLAVPSEYIEVRRRTAERHGCGRDARKPWIAPTQRLNVVVRDRDQATHMPHRPRLECPIQPSDKLIVRRSLAPGLVVIVIDPRVLHVEDKWHAETPLPDRTECHHLKRGGGEID